MTVMPYNNLVRFNANAAGTADFVVASAAPGCVTPEAAFAIDGKIYYYMAKTADGLQYEYGKGAYSYATHTLARAVLYSTSSNNLKISFTSAPIVDVFPPPSTMLEPVTEPDPFDNLILNGSHEISQENGATQITISNNTSKYTTDQWLVSYNHAAATAVVKFQQVALPGSPAIASAFPKCLQITATAALSSPASTDFASLTQYIEGQRASPLGFGSASAQPVTIGFWVYATIPGNMTVSLRSNGGGRSYATSVAINAATTWEYKTIIIPGDVTGTWLKDTGIGINMSFALAAGSSFLSGSSNSWQASNIFALTGQTNFLATAGNTVCITGVGMWGGGSLLVNAATSLASKRPPDQELPMVQRYWRRLTWSLEHNVSVGLARATNTLEYDTPMRVMPTRTRITTGSTTNVRASDPATYVTAAPLDESRIALSAEADVAGQCSALNFVEALSARM